MAEKYFNFQTGKRRKYYDCLNELLDAALHFSNVKYMKYELDFDNPSEKALEMFRETFGDFNDNPRAGKSYEKLMMAIYACHDRCYKLVDELSERLKTEGKEEIPRDVARKLINFLTFTPSGMTEKRTYNVRIKKRDLRAESRDYVEKLHAIYMVAEERKNLGKITTPSDICAIYYYREEIDSATKKLCEILQK